MENIGKSIYSLVKFGEKDNMLSLMNDGDIYLNTINYFTTIEDDFRGDTFEGASSILKGNRIEKMIYTNPLGQKIEFDYGKNENLGIEINYLIDRPNWQNKPSHMYCLYMLLIKDYGDSDVIDERNMKLGNYALVVNDPKEFIDRISQKLNDCKLSWKADIVEYIDIDQIHGEYGFFKKPKSYEYQNEYRFLISSDNEKPIKLSIGSIKDFSILLTADEIKSLREA
jgi:hypothetical protein